MKLRPGDGIVGMSVLPEKAEGFILSITRDGYGKRVREEEFRSQGRGGVGVIAIKFKPAASGSDGDELRCMNLVTSDDEVLVVTEAGVIVRLRCSDIPVQSRTATGVRVQRVDEGDVIKRVGRVPVEPEVAEDEAAEGADAGEGGESS